MADQKNQRPLTQREIQTKKINASKSEWVTLYNRLPKQAVQIQLRAPAGVDFYLGEQSVYVSAGQTAKFPVNRLYKEQIVNHQKAGRISVVSGSLD